MSNTYKLWLTKLAARIHDPAEKALVLLRDPAGHEGGTSRALQRLLNAALPTADIDPDNDEALINVAFKKPLSKDIYALVHRADWWAAAADRPQFPMTEQLIQTKKGEEKTTAIAQGSQVRWANKPVLIHPLTGTEMPLKGGLTETDIADIKQRSFMHHAALLADLPALDSEDGARKALLAFWRFAPELAEEQDNGKLGSLWGVLPSDTRIPDHSIWDHLDLTSAFAGAFAADSNQEVALLTVSLGPVQGFIAAARSTSDLWAGSHLLSRLAWELMRPLCEELGPDAVHFPRLRGIAQVDLWLRDQMGLPASLFKDCEWQKGSTDANPLFSAALPNRLVAVVPASQAQYWADKMRDNVRNWLQTLGKTVVDELLDVAGIAKDESLPCYQQMREQLHNFPEVHWAAVPFSLIGIANQQKQTGLNTTALQQAMAPFFGSAPEVANGFLASPAWQVLQQDIAWDDKTTFFAPNPGVLYPAVYDLAERIHAAAKATRAFAQNPQTGWRCALTGEVEWLTTDREQLKKSYRQQTDTLWCKVHKKQKSWAKKGEHLGALAAVKRLWPTLFADEVAKALNKRDFGRFVVSTHTMALAKQIEQWLEKGSITESGFAEATSGLESVALPRRLMQMQGVDEGQLADAKRLPALLDAARDADDETQLLKAKQLLKGMLGQAPETYYSLIMMDGDKMGAILSGDESNAISYLESFHPDVKKGFEKHAASNQTIARYGSTKRAITPNRHLAISGALNDFSQTVVRHVLESEFLGRVIYAGGDDVLAMLPVADMLPAMQRLQQAYQGHEASHEGGVLQGLTLQNGFAMLKQGSKHKLMRMMGTNATSSCGAIVAHHQAPLASVLTELRRAEKRAKNEGGRDAFSITIVKRSGGALYLTAKWGEAATLLEDCIIFLRAEGTSRRAVYNTLEWLHDLPEPDSANHTDMLASLLGYQMARQAQGVEKGSAPSLAKRLAEMASQQESKRLQWLENFLSVAEFLARETRQGDAA